MKKISKLVTITMVLMLMLGMSTKEVRAAENTDAAIEFSSDFAVKQSSGEHEESDEASSNADSSVEVASDDDSANASSEDSDSSEGTSIDDEEEEEELTLEERLP